MLLSIKNSIQRLTLEKTILYFGFLFVAILPFQGKYRFEFFSTKTFGTFNNIITPSLHTYDIAYAFLIISWFIWIVRKRIKITLPRPVLILSGLLLTFAALSSVNALYTWVSYVRLFRLLQAASLLLIIFSCSTYIHINKKELKLFLSLITSIGLFQSLLSLFQFGFQRSPLFSLLKYLGQPFLVLWEQEISFVTIMDVRFIRAYGTFPHPNILGAYLLFFIIFLFSFRKSIPPLLFKSVLLFSHLALLVTFSRTVWITYICVFVIGLFLYRKTLRKNLLPSFKQYAIVPIIGILFTAPLIINRMLELFSQQATSASERLELMKIAAQMIRRQPFTGVGIGNFTLAIRDYDFINLTDRFQQPVHNLLLLVMSEIGIIGSIAFLLLFIKAFLLLFAKNLTDHSSLRIFTIFSLIACVFLAQFDHYFWNFNAGLFYLFFLLGFAFKK